MTSRMTGLHARAKARERGVTLVIALIFMVALTLLGVGMVKSTTSEERMGANTRDYDLAFAAAEAAIRDAEVRVSGVWSFPSKPLSALNFPTTANNCGTLSTGTTSEIGLCFNITSQPIFTNTTFKLDDNTYSAQLGKFTGTPVIQGVATQPNYYIEIIQVPQFGGSGSLNAYRITSKGYGARGTTQVLLQEVYLQ
ncbi:MAG TPA: PilX N-terminal domain-containing pilus assembly protein [Burkholderiales bacterium]|nr:PilX N-terminal domain-containing pilus assembly protein [Burkholderiales bacterium]